MSSGRLWIGIEFAGKKKTEGKLVMEWTEAISLIMFMICITYILTRISELYNDSTKNDKIESPCCYKNTIKESQRALRELCSTFGDNDWDDDLHLADVIEKHLGNYLWEIECYKCNGAEDERLLQCQCCGVIYCKHCLGEHNK